MLMLHQTSEQHEPVLVYRETPGSIVEAVALDKLDSGVNVMVVEFHVQPLQSSHSFVLATNFQLGQDLKPRKLGHRSKVCLGL